MGAYSTVIITREDAIKKILDALDDSTNEEIADALFALTQNHSLNNYIVVDGGYDVTVAMGMTPPASDKDHSQV